MAPLLVEYLVGAGRPASLQGINPWIVEMDTDGVLAQMFPALMRLGRPALGGLSLEALLALHARAYVPMEPVPGAGSVALPVVELQSLRDPQWWLADAPTAARLVGDDARAAQVLRDYASDVAAIVRDLPPPAQRRRQSVFSLAPHLDHSMGSFHSEGDPWLALVGAADQEVNPNVFLINVEHLLLCDPDVIVLERTSDYTPREFMDDPRWRTLRAVRARRVYARPPAVAFTFVGILEYPFYARWLAELLYPDRMPRSLRAVMKANYARSLGYRVSDAQLDAMLAVAINRGSAHYDRFASEAHR